MANPEKYTILAIAFLTKQKTKLFWPLLCTKI